MFQLLCKISRSYTLEQTGRFVNVQHLHRKRNTSQVRVGLAMDCFEQVMVSTHLVPARTLSVHRDED